MIFFYLTIWVLVTPGACKLNSIEICEGSSNEINCPQASFIQIQSAFYSCFNHKICSTNATTHVFPINLTNVTNIVRNLCNRNSSCLIEPNKFLFDNICLNTWMHTIVNYSCYLEDSIFVAKTNHFSNITLNAFYDEFVVSFDLLNTGKNPTTVISIDDSSGSLIDFNVFDIFLTIVGLCSYAVPITVNTWSSIMISQYFIDDDNIYEITVSVNGSVQFLSFCSQPQMFTDAILYTFPNCFGLLVCNYGSIQNLSIYSNTQVIWSEWSEWSHCDTSYVITRTRNCSNNQWLNCTGNNSEVKSCSSLYQAFWSQWSNWTNCNTSYGFASRYRQCNNSNSFDWCIGNDSEVNQCFAFWTQWSNWTSCNSSYGLTSRYRQCNTSNAGDLCIGNNTEVNHCFAFWTQWSNWTSCNSSYGFTSRYRQCNTSNAGDLCIGNNTEVNQCFAFWTQWSIWTNCNSSYSFTSRYRQCNTSNAGDLCIGNNTEVNQCFAFWTQWSNWTSCSSSYGFTSRYRQCNTSNAVDSCIGNNTEFNQCFAFWTQWSNWTSCSSSYGFTSRYRQCNTSNAVDLCIGNNTEVNQCFAFWTQWSIWTSCNSSYGFTSRYRQCNTSNAGDLCIGNNTEVNQCYVLALAYWAQWSNWTCCNSSYGNISRYRRCNTFNAVDSCIGNNSEIKQCFVFWTQWSNWAGCNSSHEFMSRKRECNTSNAIDQCIGNNTEVNQCLAFWSQWSVWSSCYATYGFMNRSRNCIISNNIDLCYGNNSEITECFEKWTTWSECSVTCGIGNRSRSSLNTTAPVVMFENCYTINCPEDGIWGPWSNTECSITCGNGIKVFNRSCNKPLFNGRDCIGISNYTEFCDNNIICPVNGYWSTWSSWSLCNQPCKGGIISRFRSCSNPMPNFGGQDCNGNVVDFANCPWQTCKSSVDLNLAVNFVDEEYTYWYSVVKSAPLTFRDRIKNTISNLYSSHKVNVTLNVILHSVEFRP
ncbi:A disintegrin and metalloproteinase with thrombospondin motifs adt-1-like isoform X8 [Hydra vulgaris]|uniref:A disintegrin and metalloproteinase with thrombospondin motifs adt-1-like isoform X8 n=1 Tax=Hydra vulgaris TaxID=6087 RepID=A0ABM4BWZ9_HYDVU